LWQKSLSGEIELWIELGQPDEKRLRRACGRARQVIVYPYADRSAGIWWQQNGADFQRFDNLSVIKLTVTGETALDALVNKSMNLNCSIQEGQVWLGEDNLSATLEQTRWK
ncbi:MAG: YaeQ family protein, partial [Candidatus Thiodiazotropha sp.]